VRNGPACELRCWLPCGGVSPLTSNQRGAAAEVRLECPGGGVSRQSLSGMDSPWHATHWPSPTNRRGGGFSEEESTSHTSIMKGGNSGTIRSDLDKNNIIKPTFDTLTEEGRKSLEAYRTDLEDLFLSRYEMTQQGLILKDTMPIVIHKAEVTPEVWPNPLPSLNDVQSMINSILEGQAKSTDELLCRLIEDRDGKNLITLMLILLLALLISLKPIHKQVAHRRAALQCQTHLPSR
jgi:hypothetical protein